MILNAVVESERVKDCRLCRRPVSDREYLMLLRHAERQAVSVPVRQHARCWIRAVAREGRQTGRLMD